MSLLFVGVLSVLGGLVIWELAAWAWRRLKSTPPSDARQHFLPDTERRRQLDLRARRWPGPARW